MFVYKLYDLYDLTLVFDISAITYTEQNYQRNTFVFAPIFHELK